MASTYYSYYVYVQYTNLRAQPQLKVLQLPDGNYLLTRFGTDRMSVLYPTAPCSDDRRRRHTHNLVACRGSPFVGNSMLHALSVRMDRLHPLPTKSARLTEFFAFRAAGLSLAPHLICLAHMVCWSRSATLYKE